MDVETMNGEVKSKGKVKKNKKKTTKEKPNFVTIKKPEILREQNTTVLVTFETKQKQ